MVGCDCEWMSVWVEASVNVAGLSVRRDYCEVVCASVL